MCVMLGGFSRRSQGGGLKLIKGLRDKVMGVSKQE